MEEQIFQMCLSGREYWEKKNYNCHSMLCGAIKKENYGLYQLCPLCQTIIYVFARINNVSD
jgi:hypothetical protein